MWSMWMQQTVMDRPDQMISQHLLALRSVDLSIMFFSSRVFFPQEGTFTCDHCKIVIPLGKAF